jgi:hypothetical protein
MFFRVLNDLCDNCVDKNREKIQKDILVNPKIEIQNVSPPMPTPPPAAPAPALARKSGKFTVVDDIENNDDPNLGKPANREPQKNPDPDFSFKMKKTTEKPPSSISNPFKLSFADEQELRMDYGLDPMYDFNSVIRENNIKSKEKLIKLLKKNKKEKEKSNEPLEPLRADDEKQDDASAVIKRYQSEPGLANSRVDVERLLTETASWRNNGYRGGKKKRTKRKKTRSYRKNKRTKRNKNKKNKNKKSQK